MKKEARVLNLCGELSVEVRQYFESRALSVIDPKTDEHSYEWTHILTQDMNDFSFLRETYETIERDIEIISLTPIKDKQSFVLANGKLCLDEGWLKTQLKGFLLDKYFQDYIEPSLVNENSVFQELGHFSLNQFYSFGDHLDQLTKASFAIGVSGVAVRTYVDHLIMYMVALKNSSKMELPIEISYGDSPDAFGLQIYFSAQNLMMDDVSACLSLYHSRRAEESLLSTALNTCDFFDFSLVSNAQKMSITALWMKETELENPGFMLSWLPQKAKIVSYMKEDLEEVNEDYADPSNKIKIPEVFSFNDDIREVSRESFSEIISTRVSEAIELNKVKKIVDRELTDEEIYRLFEESAEEEEKIILGSEEELEDVVNRVSGTFDSLEVYQKDFFKEDEVLNEVINSLREKHSDVMNVKSLKNLPTQLKKMLGNFCQEKMIVKDNLTREHIKEFQVHFLKTNIKKEAVILNSKTKELVKDLKSRLEQNLKTEFQSEDVDEVFTLASQNEPDKTRVKSIFKDTLKDTLEAKFEFSRTGVISKEEENIIVRSLSSTLEEDKQVIQSILSNEEGVKPHKPLFNAETTEKEKALLVKLEALQQEKKGLAAKLQATMMEIKVLKESKSTMTNIQSKASEISSKETQQDHFDANAVLKKEIQEKLAAGTLSADDQKRLSELMEKELVLMTTVREEMMKSKKTQIELSQKEAMFASEIEKLNRQLKARDLILNKSKESLTKLTEKKDTEIDFLKNKLNQAQIDLKQENSNIYAVENRHLHIQNMNLKKQVDVYKSKINSLSANLKKKEQDNSSKDEIRKLEVEKVQLQNTLNKQQKELQRSSTMLEREQGITRDLKIELGALKEELKELQKKPLEVSEPKLKKEEKASATGPTELEIVQQTKIKTLETQVADLEMKLAEVLRAQRSNSVDDKKIQHVEASLKKITQDLIEARNQTNEFKKENNKLRQEKTALQNQLERMKKESLRAKKAA